MKKNLLLLLSCLVCSFTLHAQFNLTGYATSGGGVINLVPIAPDANCGQMRAGAAWSTTSINFNQSFTLDFEAEFINTGSIGNGADGIVVVFGSGINTAPGGSLGNGGGDMGYYSSNPDFNQSIGIEFDIFDNLGGKGDVAPNGALNHTMVAEDANPGLVLAAPVPIDPTTSNIENVGYRSYRIEWDCDARELRVYYEPSINPTPRIVVPSFNPAASFATPSNVRWGFTGGRATQCSDHNIRNINLEVGSVCGVSDECMYPEISIKHLGGCNYEFTAYANANPGIALGVYLWDFGDGVTDNTSGAVATHNYTAPGFYVVTLKIVGYDIERGQCCEKTVNVKLYVDCKEGDQKKTGPMSLNGMNSGRNEMLIAPNPTETGVFRMQLNSKEIQQVRVYTTTGHKVYEQEFKGSNVQVIDMSKLAGGLYTVEVTDSEGMQYIDKVIIK